MLKFIDSGSHAVQKVQILTLLYAVLFTFYSTTQGHYEFLFLNSYLYVFVILIPFYYRRVHMPVQVLVAFSLYCFFQVLGSIELSPGQHIGDIVFFTVPFMFHYASLIHIIGGFVSALFGYTIYRSHLDAYVRHHFFPMSIFLVTYTLGVSGFTDLASLAAVTVLDMPIHGDAFSHVLRTFTIFVGGVAGVIFIFAHYIGGFLVHEPLDFLKN